MLKTRFYIFLAKFFWVNRSFAHFLWATWANRSGSLISSSTPTSCCVQWPQPSSLMFGRQHTFNSWHPYTLYSFSARIILRNGRIVKWNGMDVSEKWMIFQFTPYQTTTLPKWMFFLKLFFKSSVLLNGQCGIQVHPQTAATTFAFSSV